MELLLFFALLLLLAVLICQILILRRPAPSVDLTPAERAIERNDRTLREELGRSRDADQRQTELIVAQLNGVRDTVEQRLTTISRCQVEHLTSSAAAAAEAQQRQTDLIVTQLNGVRDTVEKRLATLSQAQGEQLHAFGAAMTATGNSQAEQLRAVTAQQQRQTELVVGQLNAIRDTVEQRLTVMQHDNAEKLELMRRTVDEQLQSTLDRRLRESFESVSTRLEQVHKGLGEMQTLASGVGDLKRIMTGVRARGIWGELQLRTLLEEMLTPEQYSYNVAVTGTNERVEFAIRLPGAEPDSTVFLPIDSKFPLEDYERLISATDPVKAEEHALQLERRIKACAREVSEKYICVPRTTEFAILYLPSEALYAEVLRRPGMVDELQRAFRVTLTGPTTLAAFLNSLRLGFRTLAIQQRSGEVWQLLGQVKTEFGKYSDILEKVQKKLQEASNTVESGLTRTRVLERKLDGVEEKAKDQLLPGPGEGPLFANAGQ